MRILTLTVLLVGLAGSANAELFVGRTGEDASSGSALTLTLGEVLNLGIYARTDTDQNIRGLSFNLVSDNPGVLNSTSFSFDPVDSAFTLKNPMEVGGVQGANLITESDTGLLVNNAVAAALTSDAGLSSTASEPFVLLANLGISADALGSTVLSFSAGPQGVRDQDGVVTDFATGTRAINVTAIPEPGCFFLLGALATGHYGRRRRRGRSVTTEAC